MRFWKLLGSLFLKNMSTVSRKRGFGVKLNIDLIQNKK